MPISFQCSQCGTPHKAPDQLAGKKIKCKGCGHPEVVPNTNITASSPSKAATPPKSAAPKPAPPPSTAKPATAKQPAAKQPAAKQATTQPAPQQARTAAKSASAATSLPAYEEPLAADPFAAAPSLDPLAALQPTAGLQPPGGLAGAPFSPFGAAPQRPSRSMNPIALALLIVGGIVGFGMICLVAIVIWAFSRGGDDPQLAGMPNPGPAPVAPSVPPAQGQNTRPAGFPHVGSGSNTNRPLGSGSNLGQQSPSNDTAASSGLGSTSNALGTNDPLGVTPRGSSEAAQPLDDVPPLSAAVTADPLPESLKFELPATQLVSIPIERRSLAVYPDSASPFLAMISDDKKSGQLWDLRSLSQVADFEPEMAWAASMATLSPDGRYFASAQHDTVVLKPLDKDAKSQQFKLSPPMYKICLAGDRLICIDQYRDPETKKSEPRAHVYDAASGEVVKEFGFDGPLMQLPRCLAVSPGGRRLAAVVNKERSLFVEIIDAGTGQMLAEAKLPRVAGGMSPVGLAFAPEGDELTAMLSQNVSGAAQGVTRLFTWDLPDGKLAAQCALSHVDFDWLTRFGFYRGPAIEALGDHAGWLLCGQGIVDRQGNVTRELPESAMAGRDIPRRAFGPDSFLVATASGDAQMLTNQVSQVAATPRNDQVAQPTMSSSANADLSKAKKIDLPGGTIKWAVQPDPAATAKSGLGQKPTELKSVGDEPVSYHFASPTTGVVAVYCMKAKTHADIVAENEARQAQAQAAAQRAQATVTGGAAPSGASRVIPTPPVWIDRYDLASNEYLGRLNLARGSVMHDLSPNGERGLVQLGDDLQVWSLADGKQIAQWSVPGLGNHNKDFNTSCLFSDNDHVMARVDKSRVARWHLPDCNPTYVVDKLESLSRASIDAMTPGRKYWITLLQRSGSAAMVAFIETSTGQLRGVASASPFGGSELVRLDAVRVRPDGQQAALAAWYGSSQIRTFMDMNTGRIASEPGGYGDFAWAGDRHLYTDGTLYDIAYRHDVWRYQPPFGAKTVAEAADGQLWFSVRAGGRSDTPRWLALATIPESDTLSKIDDLFAGKKPLVDKGSTVSLEVSCDGPDGMSDKVRAELTKKLKGRGIEVAEGQNVRLAVTASVTETKTKEYSQIGSRRSDQPATISFNVSVVTSEAKFLAGDKTIWQTSAKQSSDPGLIVSGDIEKQEQSHWPKAERWLMALPMPSRIYAPPDKVGTSTLAFPGVVDNSSPQVAGNASTTTSDGTSIPPRLRGGRPLPPIGPPTTPGETGSASDRDHREYVAKAYAELLTQQSWDKLRTTSKLGRPLVGLRWALGTETTPETAQRDVDSFSNYSGKAIYDGLASRSERGAFGEFPKDGSAALQRPALAGSGTRSKMLTTARRHWADLLLLADIDTKRIGLTGRTNTSITVRIFDVASGDQLWASEPLKQLNFTIGKQFADYVLKHVDDTYRLAPVAATTATVASRSETLAKKELVHPLAALAEVDFYRHKELLTADAATKLYETILGIVDGRKYADADAEKRKQLIDEWLPAWIAEE